MRQSISRKRGIIQSNIHRFLRKVNQIIYIMYLNCMNNAIILVKRFSRYLDKIALLYEMPKSEKGDNSQSNIYRMLPKVNQVIYTLDTICVPNIMILAQVVLQIFCWQASIGLYWQSKKKKESRKRDITLQREVRRNRKRIRVLLFFILIPHIKFQDPISNRSWPYAKCDARTHGRTNGQAQTNMPPQLLRSWGHNKSNENRSL